jgi:AcrR family transcriptional regulator
MDPFAPDVAGSLPRGRHGLPREAVREQQRARILAAMIDVVAERGYKATCVAHVTVGARLSRRTFYDLYRGKDDCFEAAYDAADAALFGRARRRLAGHDDAPWAERTAVLLDGLLRAIASYPTAGRVVVVEVLATGKAGLARRDLAMRPLAELLAEGRAQAPAGVPALTEEILLGGVLELLFRELNAGRAKQLPERLPELAHWLTAPFTCG